MTWENFFLHADTNLPVNAQIELFQNGDFTTRSNDVERIYRRVEPFDWDGDGLENTVDPDPLVAGPDAHGTNAEWYNVVCSNVLEAVEGDGSAGTPRPTLSWLDGVNTNAYYFADVVTTNGPAPIYFTGDRDSRLGNPVVVARAFETNHVPLLIGIDYAVTSPVLFSVSFPDDGFATVTTNGVSNYTVQWPLNFVFTESIEGASRVYSVTIEPFDPGGELTWAGVGGGMRSSASSSNGCDCINYGFLSVWYTCSKNCTCGRTCRADGIYALESVAFPVEGGECRCGFDDYLDEDAPEHGYAPCVSATFSRSAVIFEDDYLESPGVVGHGGSTRVRLTLYAYGGPNGGTVSFSSANLGKLTSVGNGAYFPTSLSLAPEETFYSTGVYEGAEASVSEGDVAVIGTFTESMAAPPLVSSNSLTVAQVALQTEFTARDNPCNTRHTYGVGEKVNFTVTPALSSITLRAVKTDTTDDVTPYDTFGSTSVFLGVSEVDASASRMYICPATSTTPNITISRSGVEYKPVMAIVEPSEVVSPVAFGRGNFWPCEVGCGCLSVTNYIGPFNVSFKGIKVAEIVCTDAIPPTGYFASSNYTGQLTHTYKAGAGDLHNITGDNYWCNDNAGHDSAINNWSAGSLTWKIPIGWKRFMYVDDHDSGIAYECDYESHTNKLSRPLLIGGRADAYTQTYRIDSDGTATIEKFGWRLTRSRFSISGMVEKVK